MYRENSKARVPDPLSAPPELMERAEQATRSRQ